MEIRDVEGGTLAAGPRESMDLLGIGLNSPALSSLRILRQVQGKVWIYWGLV